jgi:hypothetical protein
MHPLHIEGFFKPLCAALCLPDNQLLSICGAFSFTFEELDILHNVSKILMCLMAVM